MFWQYGDGLERVRTMVLTRIQEWVQAMVYTKVQASVHKFPKPTLNK